MAHHDVVIASPAAMLVPVEMQPSDLLVQSLILALFVRVAGEAAEYYYLPAQWQPLRDGLRLWLIWSQELALGVWRKPLVKWVFWDQERDRLQEGQPTTVFAHDLCTSYSLWMRAPIEIGVPIACQQASGGDEATIGWRYLKYPVVMPPVLPDHSLQAMPVPVA